MHVFELIRADPAAVGFFTRGGLVQVFPFGEAPQEVTPPYAVYQTVTGSPVNHLAGRPQTDHTGLQFDVYADTQQQARDGYKALEHALELSGYITGLNTFEKDEQTNRWRASFDYSQYTPH